MAKKPTLSDVTNLASLSSASSVNNNNRKIETAFENTLSLDGSTPNAMQADFDLNSYDILNAKNISTDEITVDGIALSAQVANAAANATAAANSASSASTSASESASSAASSASSASDAEAARDEAITIAGVRDFEDVNTLLTNGELDYGIGLPQAQEDDILRTRSEGFSYKVAAETATDNHVETSGGVKLYVLPDNRGLRAEAFGADPTGVVDCSLAATKAVTAAKILGSNVIFGPGDFKVEQGIFIQGSGTISGFSTRIGFFGAGHQATKFFSHNAPDYVLKIDARYVEFGGFSITGSRDLIRDSSHSAKIGIWVSNMREGSIRDFKVQHIVGPAVRIDRCIVSDIDGIVYRSGRDLVQYNITGATQANPVVVTATGHTYQDGDYVFITGVGGMTQLNNKTFIVDNATANTFSIKSISGVDGIDVDGTGYSAYTSGGTVSDFGRMLEITNPAQDGFQASWLKLNCEDGHGNGGTFKSLSNRNSNFDLKSENQAYFICEVTSPNGTAAAGETVTFNGGASATVGLAMAAATYNTQQQLVVEDVTGTISVGNTFTCSGGATGTVAAVTSPSGTQYDIAGEYLASGTLMANQNSLKTTSAGDIIISGYENKINHAKIRGPHKSKGIVISGTDNTIVTAEVQMGLTSISDEADYDNAIEITGANNKILKSFTQDSKGVLVSGVRNTIDYLRQKSLYGQAVDISGAYSRVEYHEATQAVYTDTGGDLDVTALITISGQSASVGRLGGVYSLPYNGTNTVLLSGQRSYFGSVSILDGSSASAYVVRLTGENSVVDGAVVTVPASLVGIHNVAIDGVIRNPKVSGGATGVSLAETGATLLGGLITGYTARGVGSQPGSAKTRIRIQDVTCRDESGTPTYDIQVNNNVDYSHIINNNLHGGVGNVTYGTGANNVTTGNIL